MLHISMVSFLAFVAQYLLAGFFLRSLAARAVLSDSPNVQSFGRALSYMT